ncbi:MAG: HEAT repeat domain-containing protein [Anaerolineae bacterium]|nr:HEAT repeat domain-containing protein [Anaerolineae bacterium]
MGERQRALKQLAEFDDKRATRAMAKTLDDPSILMFMLAVRALEKIGDEIAIQALVNALVTQDRYLDEAEPSPHVSDSIEHALTRIGEPAIPALLKALYNDAWRTRSKNGRTGRWRAAWALLGFRGHPDAVSGLIAALSEADDDLKPTVAYVLSQAGTPEAAAALRSYQQREGLLKQVRAAAQTLIQDMRPYGVELTYDRASLAWLDAHIEQHCDTYSQEDMARLARTVGAFLGECLIRHYAGQWVYVEAEQRWGVNLGEQAGIAFPETKAYKRLFHGAADSLLAFFDILGLSARHR